MPLSVFFDICSSAAPFTQETFSSYVHRIIALSFVLAIGFLLVFLSCALYENWWPLFVVATYILAPLPNAICSRFDTYDVMSGDEHQGIVDAGQFITGIFIVTGFCLPSVLAHNEIITYPAMGMSIAGGLLVYGTIIVYTHFFSQQNDDAI